MKIDHRMIAHTVEALMRTGSWKATKYLTDRTIIRATRQRVGERFRSCGMNHEIILTLGRPNSRERAFIKAAKKAGEPFPIRKVHLMPLPKKRK